MFTLKDGSKKTFINAQIVRIDLLPTPTNNTSPYIQTELTDGSIFRCSNFIIDKTKVILTLKTDSVPSDFSKTKTPFMVQANSGEVLSILRDGQDSLNQLNFKGILGKALKQRRDVLILAKGTGNNRTLSWLPGTFGEGSLDKENGDKIPFLNETGKEQKLFQNRIHGIIWNPGNRPSPPPTICQISDIFGNNIYAQDILFKNKEVALLTVSGVKMSYPSISMIQRIDYSSSSLKYLSDLEPIEIEQDNNNPYVRDKNLDHEKMHMFNVVYEKGLAIHARTVLAYDIGGNYRELKGIVGVDDAFAVDSVVVLMIEADNKQIFKKLVRKSDKPFEIRLDILNVKQLRIIVESENADQPDIGNQINLAEIKVTK